MHQQMSRLAHRRRQLKLARAATYAMVYNPVDLDRARELGVVVDRTSMATWSRLRQSLHRLADIGRFGNDPDAGTRAVTWRIDVWAAHDAIRTANRLGLLSVADEIRAGLVRADQDAP